MSARGVRKAFAGVAVLEGVDIDLFPGEIHTVMGENGAGKSTLMKILAGVHRPDGGEVTLAGQAVEFTSPHAALRAGVTLIHQEPLSFPDLTVGENILLSRGLPRTFPNRIDWGAIRAKSRELLGELGVALDPSRPMAGLSVADQQMVELAAALANDARVLLMDEPTAALTPGEVDRLFTIVNRLKAKGAALVFVSHRLPEVFSVSDRITVLRDGKFIATRRVTETSTDEIVKLMVGRELEAIGSRRRVPLGRQVLSVEGVVREGTTTPVTFSVRAGEIVGLAGLVGAGRTELGETLFGLRNMVSGQVRIDGHRVNLISPRAALDAGLAYVPEDRQHNGLLLPSSIARNISLAALQQVSSAGVLSEARERDLAGEWKRKLSIRLRDVDQPVRELSGGNQQKVVLGKWLTTSPKVLIIDEPTRGVDVGAKAEVHHHLVELARQGAAIVMISSDLPEVLAMSDRILVMRGNAVVAELPGGETTQEQVMAAATGTAGNVVGGGIAAAIPVQPDRQGPSALMFLTRYRETSVLLFFLLVFAMAAWCEPRFRTAETLRTISLYIPLIAIVAMGQLAVIISRNIDLSVGSILAVSAMVSCSLFVSFPQMPEGWAVGAAVLLSVLVGLLAGIFNGVLIAWLRVPAIIATLGTMTAYRGLTYIYSGGRQIDPDKIPESLTRLAREGPAGIPWLVLIALAVAGVFHLLMSHTLWGRQVYAVGSNPEAARLRGIPTRWVTLTIFAVTGALAGLAGILFASRFGTVNPKSVGEGFELVVISAVVIGGAAVHGGAGTVAGTLLGCLLLGIVNVAMSTLRVSQFWQLALYGAAILLACLLDATLRRRAVRGGLR